MDVHHMYVSLLTVFAGLYVQHVAADPIPSLGVGQHLHTVVGELLQPVHLHLLPHCGDVLHLTPLWMEGGGGWRGGGGGSSFTNCCLII